MIPGVNFIEIGFVKKIHGTKGSLRLVIFREYENDFKMASWLFLKLFGSFVPFKILKVSGQNPYVAELENVKTAEEAEGLRTARVLLPEDEVGYRREDPFGQIVGFIIHDQKLGKIGRIEKVEEYPQQMMATVQVEDGRHLVPLNDEFIISIDPKGQRIDMDLPEGLLDLQA